jgi:ATP-binding cassette subfamily B (MDR/TAP) protein 6
MLSTLYRVIQTSLVDTDKLIALLQEEKDIKDVPDAKPLEINTGVLEFRDVRFSYDGKVEALKGINFTIKPKSKVALVGETGCGKTTILRLLYRFYDPTSGSILIDGQDIRKVTQNSLRKAIGVVPQEAGLLNTSIKTNIAYGRTEPEATDEEIDAAAAAAQILDKIRSFPDGMDTVVGERGVRLSGGEKQRVAISRCFLKSPPILLLDEATSALDSQTERQIQTALATLLEGKTSLTIAHRLSTIVNSDQILVLHDGRVVESGSHEELIAVPGGRYAAMWQSQVETDNERAEKELREKEARGKERAVDEPATEATGQTETEIATEPQPGMLGIISSSQVNAALSKQPQPNGKEAQSETIDVPAAASAPAEVPLLAPAAADPAQTVEAEVTAPLASLDSTVESTEVSGADAGVASPDQAASTAAVDVPAGGEAATAPEQAPTLTPSTSRADSTAFPTAEEATSASPIVGSPAGSASGTSTPGKIRRRLTSLMKRTPSGSVAQNGAPDADGPSSSPTSLRRTASTRSAVGGSLSRSSSFKTGTGNRLGAESPSLKPPQAPAQGASSGSRSVSPSASSSGAVSPAAGASEAPKETSPKPPSTSGRGNLSSKKKKKKDKKKM